jgi:hypothetical protein
MFDVDFFVLRKVVFDNPAKSRAAHGLGEKGEEEEVIRVYSRHSRRNGYRKSC